MVGLGDGLYDFGFAGGAEVAAVAQSLGVLAFLKLVVVLGGERQFGPNVEPVAGQHEFFLQLVYLISIEGGLSRLLQLLYPIRVLQRIERVFRAAAVRGDVADHYGPAVPGE